jgi:hypothetical protein
MYYLIQTFFVFFLSYSLFSFFILFFVKKIMAAVKWHDLTNGNLIKIIFGEDNLSIMTMPDKTKLMVVSLQGAIYIYNLCYEDYFWLIKQVKNILEGTNTEGHVLKDRIIECED